MKIKTSELQGAALDYCVAGMNLRRRFLLDRDPNAEDFKEMHRWIAIHNFEVERLARVLAYWQANPLRDTRNKSQRDCEGIAKCNTVAATALAA
jgi:hypothetical protein